MLMMVLVELSHGSVMFCTLEHITAAQHSCVSASHLFISILLLFSFLLSASKKIIAPTFFTECPISLPALTLVTDALEAAIRVDADCLSMTVVCSSSTLVNV